MAQFTPPASEEAAKNGDSSSELSDLEIEEDIGEIEPAYYHEGGKIPVFRPVSLLDGTLPSKPAYSWSRIAAFTKLGAC